MRSGTIAWGLVLVSACSAFSGGDDDAPALPDGPAADAASDGQSGEGEGAPPGLEDAAAPLRCDPNAPFGDPSEIAELNIFASQTTPRLLADERTIVFAAQKSDPGPINVYIATRDDADARFTVPTPIELDPAAGSSVTDTDPWLSPDGRTLYFASKRHLAAPASELYELDLYRASRSSLADPFRAITHLQVTTSVFPEGWPTLDAEQTIAIFSSSRATFSDDRPGRSQLFQAAVAAGGDLGPPRMLAGAVADDEQRAPALSADGLRVYFALRRAGTTWFEMVSAKRPTKDAAFGEPVFVLTPRPERADHDAPGWISPDDCRLYFARGAGPSMTLYMTERGK